MSDPSVLDWLSAPDNPAVRYLTARHLVRPAQAKRALESLRRKMLEWDPLQRILALQQQDGSFPAHGPQTTGMSTFVAVHLMDRCGMDAGDEPVARALDYLTRRHVGQGVLSGTTGGSGVLPCYVGMFVRPLIQMGAEDAPAVQGSLQWIVDYQRFDHKKTRAGGSRTWPYRAVENYGCWKSVSCYHGVVGTFRALAAIPPKRRSPAVNSRLKAAIAYLAIHRGFKKSAVDKPLFRHMTQFFLFGGYRFHLIDVLEGLADADPRLIRQRWVADAVEVVGGLAVTGRIPLVKNYPTRLIDPVPFEAVGRASRFLTYQWMRVKQKFGE